MRAAAPLREERSMHVSESLELLIITLAAILFCGLLPLH
jgi:hypothetical protein